MKNTDAIIVFDIGKTNAKLSALSLDGGASLYSQRTPNKPTLGGLYPHANVDSLWDWFCEQCCICAKHFHVRAISITTHGATIACVNNDGLTLPIMDYEWAGCESVSESYNRVRPSYDETLSPSLPGGLNVGKQLFWLHRHHPDAFAATEMVLTYPQYWAWRITGVGVSERTSLGCHTDLWRPVDGQFSSLVSTMNWAPKFPPIQPTGQVLGPITSEFANTTGLPADCEVVNGIHDSNASLVPYLMDTDPPFTVVSTGTWVVMASVGAKHSDLDEDFDMLANVNYQGLATPSARFMGGREWELLSGTEPETAADLVKLMQNRVMALPCFSGQGGPFRHQAGTVDTAEHGELTESEKTTLASIYVALMTDYCLTLLGSEGPITIEGSFAKNSIFLTAIATFRPTQQVFASIDSAGTTPGAASLYPEFIPATPVNHPPITAPDDPDFKAALTDYRSRWLKRILSFVAGSS
ncbi:hypothetical protein GH975_07835 [Litorivicinus lipolyticus]|uniref:L-fuculokinase n=1 Tax=Litorivicinus lipolyticus TaxID=418701 RepID=A0A5Q2QEQ3_9GAMM|nr:FGGY family carbohydrate kinase [Litorivicinus lipolyticus]QGG80487.1 hypothetical protein GH975_07835 [Litorivicinus lipolyticus]